MDTIIDGYNLIFQCGLQTTSTASDMLHQSRSRLLQEIASFAGVAFAKRTTIVFDAAHRPPQAKTNRYRIKDVLVLYADQFDDADTMIEYLISKHATPKKLTVVSSDHRLHKSALRRKATPIDSAVWYDRLLAGKFMSKTESVKLPQPDGLSDVDWHHELKLSAVDLREIEAEVAAEQSDNAVEKPTEREREEVGPRDARIEDVASLPGEVGNPFPPGYGEDLLEK